MPRRNSEFFPTFITCVNFGLNNKKTLVLMNIFWVFWLVFWIAVVREGGRGWAWHYIYCNEQICSGNIKVLCKYIIYQCTWHTKCRKLYIHIKIITWKQSLNRFFVLIRNALWSMNWKFVMCLMFHQRMNKVCYFKKRKNKLKKRIEQGA